jgi:hypothetical protein
MLSKALAWSSFGLALLFIVITLACVFAWDSLGGDTAERLQMARTLFWFAALPALGLAMLLALAVLCLAAFQTKD